jgi:alginate O-acetyltransferase complex protein AlgI
MLFNSFEFLIFLPIVFIFYWAFKAKGYKVQNVLLLVFSYYFYASWDYRFLFLLIFSTSLDYVSGLFINKTQSELTRKIWFWTSILTNLGFLGIFKYYNFFASSFKYFLFNCGYEVDIFTLNIILPVGISFYTFHGLSYVIDIYNRKIEPEKNIVNYSLFVSYFPLLVAGPIERATHLLPQLKKERNFNYYNVVNGLKQILWGLFKKIVIADNCAEFANASFNNPANHDGSTLLLGAIFFAFQIYGDFSGYSDIALGVSRLLGIELLQNFSFPYFSRDIAEFWRRWHISLSSWFKDYVYIPLGGSKGGTWLKIRNTFIIFLLSGFWHGANWTFIIWGGINAIYFLPLFLSGNNRNNLNIVAVETMLPNFKELFLMLSNFFLVTLVWVFFRADNLGLAFVYLKGIFTNSLFTIPHFGIPQSVSNIIILLSLFILIEWIGRKNKFALDILDNHWNKYLRALFYYLIILSIFLFGGKSQQFIYFQF